MRKIKLVGDGPKAILATEGTAMASPTPPRGGLANVLRIPEQLPILLAGPIIRRVEATRATIWLLTSVDVQVRGVLTVADSGKVVARTTAASTPLGERMYMHLATFASEENAGFPRSTLLAYNFDLELAGDTPGIAGFAEGKVLLNAKDIAYNGRALPTFFVPADTDEELNVLHGSCRKLHGAGVDAAARLCEMIAEHYEDVRQRPSALFLTGDQIYADDVDKGVIEEISMLSRALLGWDETIPVPGGGMGRVAQYRAGSRVMVREPECGFSVNEEDAVNHLLGFGEFAAMYILAWCPEIWTWPRFRAKASFPVFEHALSVGAIRCVMANVPCYMMFDDHEITDDWYINPERKRRTNASSTARRIMANGLAAYWVFQEAGNDPGSRDAPVASAVASYLLGQGSGTDDFEKALLGFHKWHYVAPTTFPAVVLDTRTQRQFIQASGVDGAPSVLNPPPELLDFRALRALTEAIQACSGDRDDPVLIVSPAPVIGFIPVENFLKRRATLHSNSSNVNLYYDPEAWMYNAAGFSHLMRALARSGRRKFLFLSGDVHFGFSASANCVIRDGDTTTEITVFQATSSALRNEATGKLKLGLTLRRTGGENYRVGSVGGRGYELSGTGRYRIDLFGLPPRWDLLIRWNYERMGEKHTVIENNAGRISVDRSGLRHVLRTAHEATSACVEWEDIGRKTWAIPKNA